MKKFMLKVSALALVLTTVSAVVPFSLTEVSSATYLNPPSLAIGLNQSTAINGSFSQKHDLRMGTWTHNSKEGSGATGILLDNVSVGSTSRGLSLVAWDSNFNVIKNVNYDTYGNPSSADYLAYDIDTLPQGCLVAIQSFDAYSVSSSLRSSLYCLGVPNTDTMNTDADAGVDCGNYRVTFQYACYKGSPCTPLLYYYDRNGYTYVDNTLTVGSSGEYITVNSSNCEKLILPEGQKIFSNSVGTNPMPIFRYYVYSNGVKRFQGFNSSINNADRSINVTNLDTVGPTVYDTKILNQDENGYDVDVWVKDELSGVNYVSFHTWIDHEGQDDLGVWGVGTLISTTDGSQQWRYHVAKSSHNNEMGMYNTGIYAHDKVGNFNSFGVKDINLVPNLDATITDNIPTTMEAGQTYPVKVTVKNTGNTPWTSATNFKLGGHAFDWGSGNSERKLIANGVTVNKGESYDFKFNITAPSTPGTYTGGKFKMVQENVAWFGSELNKTITVVDTTKPTGVFSPNGCTWRNKGIDVTITPTDSGSGVKSTDWYYSDDGELTWKHGFTGNTVINWWDTWNTSTARTKVIITDNANNSTTMLSNYFKIDSTNPVIGAANNPETRYTNASTGTMKVQVNNVTDNLSGVAGADCWAGIDNGAGSVYSWIYNQQATTKDGTNPNWYWNFPLTSSEGIYRIRIHSYDNAGNGEGSLRGVNQSSIWSSPVDQIVVIDRTAPTISVTGNPTTWTNANVTLTVAGADINFDHITLPDSTTTTLTSKTYTVSANGTYVFKVTDKAGNATTQSVVVNKIDKTLSTLGLSANTTAPTNGNVTITANSSDSSSGVLNITKPDGTIVAGSSATYVVSANGTYSFKSKDNTGNEVTQSITISNIDKTAPIAPVFKRDITGWTNGNVKIAPEYSVTDSSVNMLENGDFTNGLTNWSANMPDSSVTLTNIDTTYGKGVRVTKAVGSLGHWPLNYNKTIAYKAGKTYTLSWYYRLTQGSGRPYNIGWWVDDNGNYRNCLSVNEIKLENGWIYAEASYAFISNHPSSPGTFLNSMADNITAEFANIRLTENTMEYKTTPTGLWLPYNCPISVSSNSTLYARYKDNVGNISHEGIITIGNIDKTAPTIDLSKNTETTTIDPITITATGSDSLSGVKSITNPDNSVTEGNTSSYIVDKNGTYEFLVTDNAGNKTTKSITVNNIVTDSIELTISSSALDVSSDLDVSVKSTNPYEVSIMANDDFTNSTVTSSKIPATALGIKVDSDTYYSKLTGVGYPNKIIGSATGTIGQPSDLRLYKLHFSVDQVFGYRSGVYQIPLTITLTSK